MRLLRHTATARTESARTFLRRETGLAPRTGMADLGISDQDSCQGSELAYQGPEVAPLALVAHGAPRLVRHLASTLGPADGPNGCAGRGRPPRDLSGSRPPAMLAKPAGRPVVAATSGE